LRSGVCLLSEGQSSRVPKRKKLRGQDPSREADKRELSVFQDLAVLTKKTQRKRLKSTIINSNSHFVRFLGSQN